MVKRLLCVNKHVDTGCADNNRREATLCKLYNSGFIKIIVLNNSHFSPSVLKNKHKKRNFNIALFLWDKLGLF